MCVLKVSPGDQYTHEIGFEAQAGQPPKRLQSLSYAPGESYAMAHPLLWHRVLAPAHGDMYTLMVTWKTDDWTQKGGPKPPAAQRALNSREFDEVKSVFQQLFPMPLS